MKMWNPITEIYCKYLVWKIKKEDPTFEWGEEQKRMSRDIKKYWLKCLKPMLDPEWGNRDLDVEDSFEIPGENQ